MSFSKRDTCETIKDLSGHLAMLCAEAELDVLDHLLSMVRLEADNTLLTLDEPKTAPVVVLEATGPGRRKGKKKDSETLVAFAP